MREIKFRGRHIDTGEFVYAELGQISAVSDDPNLLLFLTEKPCLVHTNSIAQFVGHDAAGNEIYEGDTVVLNSPDYHIEYTSHLSGYATGDRGIYISAGQFDRVTLKEAHHE